MMVVHKEDIEKVMIRGECYETNSGKTRNEHVRRWWEV